MSVGSRWAKNRCRIGLNVDEAQVLFGQIFPFVVEIVPFDAAPQVMTIRARALDTGIKFL